MTRRHAMFGALGALIAALLLWWLLPEPLPADPILYGAVLETEAESVGSSPSIPGLVAGGIPPVETEDGPPEEETPAPEREEEAHCLVEDMPLGVPVRAEARAGGEQIDVMAIAVEKGIQLGGLQGLRRRLANASRAPVGDLIGLVAHVEGVGEIQARLRGRGDDWTCSVVGVQPVAWLEGRVLTDRGLEQRRVAVFACGRRTIAESDGSYVMRVPTDGGRCTVHAARQDGAFLRRSEIVEIDPRAGEDLSVDLELPDDVTGGVGVQIRRHPLGIRVARVLRDSPAADAGLKRGDVVVSVDGIPSVDLSETQFVDAAVGAAGTDVVYTLLRDDEEIDVVMTREARDR